MMPLSERKHWFMEKATLKECRILELGTPARENTEQLNEPKPKKMWHHPPTSLSPSSKHFLKLAKHQVTDSTVTEKADMKSYP